LQICPTCKQPLEYKIKEDIMIEDDSTIHIDTVEVERCEICEFEIKKEYE